MAEGLQRIRVGKECRSDSSDQMTCSERLVSRHEDMSGAVPMSLDACAAPLGRILLEISGGRTFQDRPVGSEARSVQWAVPRHLGIVPPKYAAQVRADG